VNTSRGPIVDEAALVSALREGRISAGLDVFDREPLPDNHPLRTFPNAVLTPHLGYSTIPVFRQFYGESIENILAFLDSKPIRVMNAEALDAALAKL
jgi:phosphoglycerate dehydrogenase-like enzyme